MAKKRGRPRDSSAELKRPLTFSTSAETRRKIKEILAEFKSDGSPISRSDLLRTMVRGAHRVVVEKQ